MVAFAGIGRPDKFFRTLEGIGAFVGAEYSFPDHHIFSRRDIERVLGKARELSAIPVTTAKDAVRLPAELRHQVRVLSVEVVWDDPALVDHHLARLFPPPPDETPAA